MPEEMTCRVISTIYNNSIVEWGVRARPPEARRAARTYALIQSSSRREAVFTVQTWNEELKRWVNPDVIYQGYALGEHSSMFEHHAYPTLKEELTNAN